MTSSARCSSDCGMINARALAVLRLITSSNFVVRSTERSPGLAPFRILSTNQAARRNEGEAQDLRDIVVDLTGADDFARQVYEAAREIPAGQPRTYGEIAKALGQPAKRKPSDRLWQRASWSFGRRGS